MKTGIKTAVRTPKKTLMFSAILLLLAVLLSVAFCVYTAINDFLQDCRAYFHTIVNVEYLGERFPDGKVYDAELAATLDRHSAELDALCSSDAVLSFEPTTQALASVSSLHRKDQFCRDPEAAVLCVQVTSEPDFGAPALGTITDCLYSRADVTGQLVQMLSEELYSPNAHLPQYGKSYLVCGHFLPGNTGYLCFEAQALSFAADGENVTVKPYTEVEELSSYENNDYRRLADFLAQRNNSCAVQYTACLEDYLPFHQQELVLAEGRSFTQEEYAQAAKVCIVSSRVAGTMGLSVGDRIDLFTYTGEGDIFELTVPQKEPQSYEVIGICAKNDSYPVFIYLPDAAAAEGSFSPVNGYRLGQFRLDNDGVAAFLTQAQPLKEDGFHFTVYDQGYAATVEPMQELLFLSVVFLCICLLAALAVLCLQCHLLVSGQQDAAQTMLALGSGRAYVYRSMLGTAFAPALPAIALGCFAGKLLEQGVFSFLVYASSQLQAADLRFSASRLSLTRTLEFIPRVPSAIYLCVGIGLLLVTLLLTFLFEIGCFKRPRRRRAPKKRLPKVRNSSHLSGRLKYALLSVRRNLPRSGAIVLLAAVMALFFGQLNASLSDYQAQITAVETQSVITGHATDITGQGIDGLVVAQHSVEQFIRHGLLSSYSFSDTIGNARFMGIPTTADGETHAVDEPVLPSSPFGMETFIAQMGAEPRWIRSASVSESPQLFYSEAVKLRFLDGYSEDSFAGNEWICALPQTMMDKNGIQLGDTARFLYAIPHWMYGTVINTVDLKVVCSYLSTRGNRLVISPVGCVDLEVGSNFHVKLDDQKQAGYDSFLFTLKNAADLDTVREALAESGFIYVRSGERIGTYAVLEDEMFLSTTQSMKRQLQYLTVLYDGLYLLCGLLALVLARLITATRRPELAILCALGTQRSRMILNFFTEQALLCGSGLSFGLLLWWLSGRSLTTIQLMLSAAFFVLWTLSSLRYVRKATKKQLILTEKE